MRREQRKLNFRREENNVVEWAWITKEFCSRLIISSCKNTKAEARLARDVSSRQILTVRPAEWDPTCPLGR